MTNSIINASLVKDAAKADAASRLNWGQVAQLPLSEINQNYFLRTLDRSDEDIDVNTSSGVRLPAEQLQQSFTTDPSRLTNASFRNRARDAFFAYIDVWLEGPGN